MPDPVRKPGVTEEANARFRRPRTLEEMTAGVQPIESWDDLAIPDLTDEEWQVFAAALKNE